MTEAATPTAAATRTPALTRALVGLTIVATLALVAFLAIGVARGRRSLSAGQAAPEFAFSDFHGGRHDLETYRGKVVVLNFWASWCVECLVEAAELEAIARDYGPRGVQVLGLAYTDTEPAARAYAAAQGMTFPSGMDRAAAVSARYGLTGVPETVVIDQEGRLVAVPQRDGSAAAKIVGAIAPGGVVEPATLRALLDGLLQGEAP